jgi:hypothetical protein
VGVFFRWHHQDINNVEQGLALLTTRPASVASNRSICCWV